MTGTAKQGREDCFMYRDVIGIVGGMGSFATLGFYQRVLQAFPANKEWERPHIVVDNFCTMPSRVRAILYDEDTERLKRMLCASVDMMRQAWQEQDGKLYVILACNTAHYFLPYLSEHFSDVIFVNILQLCADAIRRAHCDEVWVLASEGTVATRMYDHYLEDVRVQYPEQQMREIRAFIEVVKQQPEIPEESIEAFHAFLESAPVSDVVLGCTELPVLYQSIVQNGLPLSVRIFDPLEEAIRVLQQQIS